MSNTFQNLHHNPYLFYNHHTTMINEYNNPNLIVWMFSTLFPFGMGILEMNNRPIKIITNPCKNIISLNETCY